MLRGAMPDMTGASRDTGNTLLTTEVPARSSAANVMSTATASIADIDGMGRLAVQTSMVSEVHEVEAHSVAPTSSVVFVRCESAAKLRPKTVTCEMLAVLGRLSELIHVMTGGSSALVGGNVVGVGVPVVGVGVGL
jgi:hypothetical protein